MSISSRLRICGLSLILALAGSAPAAADTRYRGDDARAELDVLYATLQASHFDLYARRPKAEYDALHARLRASFGEQVEQATLERVLQRFVAFGRIAHARIDLPDDDWQAYRDGGGAIFPLLLRVIDGAVYVDTDFSGLDGIAPGDRVRTIEGRDALAWLAPLRAALPADNDYLAYTLMENQLPKLVWRARGAVAQFSFGIERDGVTRTVRVPAATPAQVAAALAARADAPAWDRREARMLEGGVAYLRPGPFFNSSGDADAMWDNAGFVAFIDAAFEDFLAHDARVLLIDLRDNPGGDNSFSDPMVAWLASRPFRFCQRFEVKSSEAARASNRRRLMPDDTTSITARYEAAYAAHAPGDVFAFEIDEVAPRTGRRFEGRVLLLVNRHSYSNTVMVAALAQDYGFAQVLGEETADLATTYGAMESFTLPRSGLAVGFPKARIVRPSGALDARGVIPDVAIASPLTTDADDAVLQQALRIARAGARE